MEVRQYHIFGHIFQGYSLKLRPYIWQVPPFQVPEMAIDYIYTGWWLSHPSEKYDFVSWDDDIPKIWKNKKMFQTTNQYIYVCMELMECIYIYIYGQLIEKEHVYQIVFFPCQ